MRKQLYAYSGTRLTIASWKFSQNGIPLGTDRKTDLEADQLRADRPLRVS